MPTRDILTRSIFPTSNLLAFVRKPVNLLKQIYLVFIQQDSQLFFQNSKFLPANTYQAEIYNILSINVKILEL